MASGQADPIPQPRSLRWTQVGRNEDQGMALSCPRGAPSRVNPAKHYLVCTTPRTGSSLLCSLLARTGLAGMHPRPTTGQEYLLDVSEGKLETPNWETVDLREYLAQT